jgi:photosystem II stability/assembly factor-like uncharacterized protein
MRWRNIGPYRAGRTKAAAGVPSQPYTFYIGMVNGGVWKTTDAGRTWKPIFDDQPTGSIGWVAVAPSDPNVIYVGSGEGLPRPDLAVGDGIYKSTDAGQTWTHLGLRDAQQIPKIAIDPKNANRLFVAALGHPYGPNEERGSSARPTAADVRARAVQGREHRRQGRRHRSVQPRHRLRDVVGAAPGSVGERRVERHQRRHLQVDRRRHDVEAAEAGAARRHRQRRARRSRRATRALYATLEATAAAPASIDPTMRGETWTRSTTDTRPTSRINEAVPHVHPKDADTLIVTDVVSYKSTDGGKTFVPFKGAPGGDDNQNIWWNPNDPNIMLLVIDQGAVVTLNGGQTWSSWFTQPTAALYHVMTDNAFPYACAAASRTAGRCASPAAATTGRSRSASGIRSAWKSTATPHPIRWIRTWSTAAR